MATKIPTFYKKEEGGITWQLLGDQPSRQKGARWNRLALLGDQPSTKKKVELFNGCQIYDYPSTKIKIEPPSSTLFKLEFNHPTQWSPNDCHVTNPLQIRGCNHLATATKW